MKKKILIIEDNEQNMYLLTYLLQDNDYEVLQSFNGAEGISMAILTRPDLILLDIQLPEMDGYMVTSEIRKHDESSHIPIVVVTSYAMPGDEEKALESGANGYIVKPVDPDTFISQIKLFLK